MAHKKDGGSLYRIGSTEEVKMVGLQIYFGGRIVSRIWLEKLERYCYGYMIWGRLGDEQGWREISRVLFGV